MFIRKDNGMDKNNQKPHFQIILVPLIYFALGFYDGFFGPGTGSLLIIAFNLILGMNLVESSGTAKIFNLSSNIAALVIFAMNGRVDYILGGILALSNMGGNWLGSSLALKRGHNIVRYFLALSSIILLVSLFIKISG